MAEKDVASLISLVTKHETALATAWMRNQVEAGSLRSGQITEDELTDQWRRFLREFVKALKSGQVDDITGPAWSAARDLLGEISRSRALQGFTPTETATFVFSIKEPLFTLLNYEIKGSPTTGRPDMDGDEALRQARSLHRRDLCAEPRGHNQTQPVTS